VIRTVPGTTSACAERVLGGYYVNVEPDRAALDRYGLSIRDVQEVVRPALGGETVTTIVEGRERFGVNVRYPRGACRRCRATGTRLHRGGRQFESVIAHQPR
jgi:Cu(I)/Ag(I) efflux system membrane protein CusA/SilA